MMSKELIDAIDKNDHVGAERIFKDSMVQKVGNTLEVKRKELAQNFVNQKQEKADE